MAYYQNLPLFKEVYDLLIQIFTVSKTFQRDFRYTVGEELKKRLLDMIICLFRANRDRSKSREVSVCRECAEEVKIYLRILHDLKQLSLKQYVALAERTERISRQLAAWNNYLLKRQSNLAQDVVPGNKYPEED